MSSDLDRRDGCAKLQASLERSDNGRWMMAVQAVRVVSVPVSDQDRAKEFYVDKLGFELTRDDDSIPGLRWVQVTPERGSTSLTLVTWFETMPPGCLQGIVLTCDSLERDCAELEERGVEFERPLQDQPWGREAVVRDPDGNRLVLQQA